MEQRTVQVPIYYGANGGMQQTQNMNSGFMNQFLHWGVGNPYTGLPMDKAAADKLYSELIVRTVECQNSSQRCQQEHQFKLELEAMRQQQEKAVFDMRKDLENTKLENALKRDEALYQLKMNRELAQNTLFENSDGFLCLEMTFPDGKKVYSKPVVSRPFLRMICLYASDNQTEVIALVGVEMFKEKFTLLENQFSALGLGKALGRKGVAITVCRERRKQVREMLFAHLAKTASKRVIPSNLGWNQIKGDWVFMVDETKTMRGVKKGVYEYDD